MDKMSTAQKIADQHNVKEKTVRRAEKFADGVDKIAVEAEEICRVIAEAVEAERKAKIAEAMKGNENRKDPEQIRELIPPSEKKQSQPEANKTRAKIAETFNTGAGMALFCIG